MIKDDIENAHKVAEKLPGIINVMSQNILTNLSKIRHLEERIKILEQRDLHRSQNNIRMN
jgi:hypothetical protein|tara:strand:+ start:531 stop:710 length:180 start_codon:yes stop_codon:yes gene_type:complete